MKPVNVPNLIPLNTVMNATINSVAQQVYNAFIFSIQIVFTGTPTGSFKLQASSDPAFSGMPNEPTHWTDIANSTFAVTAAGNVMWNNLQPGYNWVRVVYTDTSSGSSTAIITDSTFNAKGF